MRNSRARTAPVPIPPALRELISDEWVLGQVFRRRAELEHTVTPVPPLSRLEEFLLDQCLRVSKIARFAIESATEIPRSVRPKLIALLATQERFIESGRKAAQLRSLAEKWRAIEPAARQRHEGNPRLSAKRVAELMVQDGVWPGGVGALRKRLRTASWWVKK